MSNLLIWINDQIDSVLLYTVRLGLDLNDCIDDTCNYLSNLLSLCASIDPQLASFECRVVNSFSWLAFEPSSFNAWVDEHTFTSGFEVEPYSFLIDSLDIICLSISAAFVWFTLFAPNRARNLTAADSTVLEAQEESEWDSDSGVELDWDTVEEDSEDEEDQGEDEEEIVEEKEIVEQEEEVRGRTLTRDIGCCKCCNR